VKEESKAGSEVWRESRKSRRKVKEEVKVWRESRK
jgi:hypothetical protein